MLSPLRMRQRLQRGNAAGNNIAITVNTGVGDPNAIAEAIENVITEAVSRGTLRGLQIA
jgi:hypothetical protein